MDENLLQRLLTKDSTVEGDLRLERMLHLTQKDVVTGLYMF